MFLCRRAKERVVVLSPLEVHSHAEDTCKCISGFRLHPFSGVTLTGCINDSETFFFFFFYPPSS